MKRIRAQVEITRRTYVAFEVDDNLDDEEIKALAIEEAERAEWEDDPPEVVSFEVLEEP
jgi:acid stress-induced BolA-like protein IbaG/YrbA